MRVTETARRLRSFPDRPVTRVLLPPEVTRPFQVYLNGVLQREAVDFVVRDGALLFERDLREEGRLGLMRWARIVFGIAGSYGRNDSVDVVYEREGQPAVAAKLPLEQLG